MIGRIWNWLFYFCRHEWQTVRQGPIVANFGGTPHGYFYDLRCEKCGDMKTRNLM